MKKKLVKILFIIVALLCVIGAGVFIYRNIQRYHIDSPMPDIEYKKAILRDSHNMKYTLEALRPLMGPEELTEFIKKNDDNPQIYTPSDENIETGKYGANFHIHTTMSDGVKTVEERMREAQEYAQNNIKDGYMVIALTDHNTVWAVKEIIKTLQAYPYYFKNIKIVPGIEISTQCHVSKLLRNPIDVHVLLWAVNPYDKFLGEFFKKEYSSDMINLRSPIPDFDWVIDVMSDYGIVGIAHPARYTTRLGDGKYDYITELFTRYKGMNGKVKFVEGYYQSYKQTSTGEHLGSEYDKYINYINSEAKRLGIIRTGSTDAHGETIFKYR